MILSDRDLQQRLQDGDLVVDPLDDWNHRIQPASIDLRLGDDLLYYERPRAYIGRELEVQGNKGIPMIEPTRLWGTFDPQDAKAMETFEKRLTFSAEQDVVRLAPGAFVLATTLERVRIPHDLVGKVEGKSSLGRIGLVVHMTAGFLDPGFEGQITLEISAAGGHGVLLRRGMLISQIAFTQLTRPAERPYGHPTRKSRYQWQRGATPARVVR